MADRIPGKTKRLALVQFLKIEKKITKVTFFLFQRYCQIKHLIYKSVNFARFYVCLCPTSRCEISQHISNNFTHRCEQIFTHTSPTLDGQFLAAPAPKWLEIVSPLYPNCIGLSLDGLGHQCRLHFRLQRLVSEVCGLALKPFQVR